jgi:hypothetical protein
MLRDLTHMIVVIMLLPWVGVALLLVTCTLMAKIS